MGSDDPPQLFARISIIVGEDVLVDRNLEDDKLELARKKIENELNSLGEQAKRVFQVFEGDEV